jgi:hypothetical protein
VNDSYACLEQFSYAGLEQFTYAELEQCQVAPPVVPTQIFTACHARRLRFAGRVRSTTFNGKRRSLEFAGPARTTTFTTTPRDLLFAVRSC